LTQLVFLVAIKNLYIFWLIIFQEEHLFQRQTTKEIISLLDKTIGNEDVKILLADQYSAINSKET